jgi:hypothetical protein
MPGFVKTKKDEKTWEKAKGQAEKADIPKGKGGKHSDNYWAYANKVFHKLKGKKKKGKKRKSSMTPDQLSMELRSIASVIDSLEQPSRVVIADALEDVISDLDD